MRIFVCLGLIVLFFAALPINAASVWKVSKNGSQIFLGGTVHLLGAKDHPLPKAYDQALSLSQKLVFEANIDETKTPEFQVQAMGVMLLPQGATLDQVLKPSTMAALQAYMTKNALPLGQFMGFTPAGLALILQMKELQEMGMQEQFGVDVTLHTKAKAQGKTIAALETVEFQLDMLKNMANGEEDRFILYTLRDIERAPELMGSLVAAWREGDMGRMERDGLQEMRVEYPQIHRTLVLERNAKWLPKIEAMLRETETVEYVLVGALHLAGAEGLLQQLKLKGYAVSRL
jgi:uncharacterized protein YbaP (TraB family)